MNFTKVEIKIRKEVEGEKETALLVDYWHPGLNRVPAISLRAQSDEKVFLYRICKQHVCFKAARYVVNSFKGDACSVAKSANSTMVKGSPGLILTWSMQYLI